MRKLRAGIQFEPVFRQDYTERLVSCDIPPMNILTPFTWKRKVVPVPY